jgi:hypothetical protein
VPSRRTRSSSMATCAWQQAMSCSGCVRRERHNATRHCNQARACSCCCELHACRSIDAAGNPVLLLWLAFVQGIATTFCHTSCAANALLCKAVCCPPASSHPVQFAVCRP